MIAVEICADSPEGVEAALRGGADRIELCTALALGGLTPSMGLIAEARRAIDARHAAAGAAGAAAELVVLIRPRPGDFVHDEREARVMEEDIGACARLGADSVAVGPLLPTAKGFAVDTVLLERLARAAREAGLRQSCCCFHRAFDLVEDRTAALEQIAANGLVGRVLTSGGAARAVDQAGCAELAALVRQADRLGGRVEIVAAGGIRPENVADVVRRTGVRQVHSAATGAVVERAWRQQQKGHDRHRGGAVLGSAGVEAQDEWRCADEETVRAIVREAKEAAAAAGCSSS
jgi:copper homeostasis protein